MQTTKDLKIFERKNGTIVLSNDGAQYIITSAQRVRMDLVLATKSVRTNINDAIAKFNEHKACIKSYAHCRGDEEHWR